MYVDRWNHRPCGTVSETEHDASDGGDGDDDDDGDGGDNDGGGGDMVMVVVARGDDDVGDIDGSSDGMAWQWQ